MLDAVHCGLWNLSLSFVGGGFTLSLYHDYSMTIVLYFCFRCGVCDCMMFVCHILLICINSVLCMVPKLFIIILVLYQDEIESWGLSRLVN
jgi:hypothetical protein